MTRIDAPFIQHPFVTIVNSLHSPSQQTTRADQQRRDHVAKHTRTKYTHQLVIEWTVVVHRSYQDQLIDALRVIEGAGSGDGAAVRTAHERRAFNLQAVEQTNQQARLSRDSVFTVSRFAGVAKAEHIDRDHAKAGGSEAEENFAPNESRRRKAVNQNEHRRVCIARFLVVNTNPLDVYEARVVGVKDDVAIAVPVSIARACEKSRHDG